MLLHPPLQVLRMRDPLVRAECAQTAWRDWFLDGTRSYFKNAKARWPPALLFPTSCRLPSHTMTKIISTLGHSFLLVLIGCASPTSHGDRSSERLTSIDTELFYSTTGLPEVNTIEYT